jgi:regulator of sirC expression with transglutaminase-like and TPR domain
MDKKSHARIFFCSTLLLSLLAVYCARHPAAGSANTFPALPKTITLEQASILVSRNLMSISGDADTISLLSFYRTLDSAAACLSQSLGGKKASAAAVDSILAIVYKTWDVQFDPRDTIAETMLPHLVYKNRKGACLGVSLIMLMLAERLGCPLYGVMLPGHFFCRYDSGTQQVNIEPNKAGYHHPNEYYAGRYPVEGRPWYDFANLTKSKTIGMLCYNAGTLCMSRRQYGIAIAYFKEAADRIDGFAEAKGNLALAYARAGMPDSSLAVFEKLFAAHPDFVNLAANYGSVAMTAKQYEKAERIFMNGLEYFPEDTVLLSGLSQVYMRLEAP